MCDDCKTDVRIEGWPFCQLCARHVHGWRRCSVCKRMYDWKLHGGSHGCDRSGGGPWKPTVSGGLQALGRRR
jgi:hypothetical protein